MGGGKIEVFIMQELLISRPHKGLERNTFIGLDIFNKVLWKKKTEIRGTLCERQ